MAGTWSMPRGSGDRWPLDYERGRPGWPAAVLDIAGVPPDATVLDLGAGTGKLTRLLVARFRRVVAVEPSDEMRRLLVELCPQAEALAGTGQAIPLDDASVEAVFAAQAFHWFRDGVDEVARVLRPGGAFVATFNVPAEPWQPSTADAERLLAERIAEGELGYDPLDLGSPHADDLRESFAGTPFEELRETTFVNPQTLDPDGLVAYYASMGWLAELPDDERLPLLREVASRLQRETHTRVWQTRIYWTRRLRG